MNNQPTIDFVTIQQVCHMMSFSRATIYNLIRRDNFPAPIKIGKASRWVRQSVEDWMRAKLPEAA